MTKLVLQSGGIRHQPELKRQFHQELVTGLGNSPKILLCNFAQGREYWNVKFAAYSNSIAEDMPAGINPTFMLAMPADFSKQCAETDIIYFHGGDDHLLQYWMRQFDITELFKEKVVATNSASSDLLATHHWTSDWRHCADGFGILPIKFIPHYMSTTNDTDPRGPVDWKAAYDQLQVYGDTSLPIYALQEGEFMIVENGEVTTVIKRVEALP